MKFGMNLLLWTDDPTQDHWLPTWERLAKLGFDGLELPMMGPGPEAFGSLGKRLADLGVERTATVICNADTDPISRDPSVRQAALDHLKRSVDCCVAAGATVMGGPLYAAIGEFSGSGPSEDELNRSADVLRDVADYAASADVRLSFEFLNRFEIYLLNTAEQTRRYVERIGRPNVGVHYDTFHAHIEEKDPAAAIRAAGDSITHVHLSENDRGTPGAGQVRWGESFDALAEIGYDGWLTIEAFGSSLPALAAATKIWRPLFESEKQLARDGLAFIRSEWEKRSR